MKTEIKKSELKKVYDIACPNWQLKIEKYTQRNPFGDSVEFTEKEIEEMISASTPEQLPVVKEVFNVVYTWESIKTLSDTIKYLGQKDDEVILLNQLTEHSLPRHIIAEQELVVITKAINECKELDWNNQDQPKHLIWWYLGNNYRLCVTCSYTEYSCCSPRLCFISHERAKHASQYFKDTYKDYLTTHTAKASKWGLH